MSDSRSSTSSQRPEGSAHLSGPVPVYECEFQVGQAVHVAEPSHGEDPDQVLFISGIEWRHQRDRADHGWNITVVSRADVERGYGATDGYRPEDLRPAFPSRDPIALTGPAPAAPVDTSHDDRSPEP